MTKFQVNDIVWVKKDSYGSFWPAKIRRIPAINNLYYQVQLFSAKENSGLQSTTSTCPENNLLPFIGYRCDQRQTPKDLYQAYIIAKRQLANLKDIQDNSISQKHQENKMNWTKQDINNFLQGMLEETLSEEEIHTGRISCINYQFKPDTDESKYFFEENLCQIICFLLGEKKLDSETKMCLNDTKRKMKAAIIEVVMRGDLSIIYDSS